MIPRRRDCSAPEDRSAELKRRVEQTVGAPTTSWQSEALPPEDKEAFWRRVLEHESAQTTTNFQQLTEAGVALPHPDALNDEAIGSMLWMVIRALARMGVFISHTNHLSDRELYTALWRDVLRHEVPDVPVDPDSIWYVDLLGGGTEADIACMLKYYADEKWRQDWLRQFPDDPMPAHEDPPFDRDRHLPKPEDEEESE